MRRMGRRSASQSVVALFVAFVEESTWTQAALARRLGVTVPVVRKHLSELMEAGCPLERQEEHPHVYWSMRKGWMPGGVTLTGPDLGATLRLLARTPRTQVREQLLAKLLRVAPAGDRPVPNDTQGIDDSIVATLEDSAQRRQAVRIRYVSTSTGDHAARHVSVHRVEYGPPLRFVATCHRTDSLKWFRGDNVVAAEAAPNESFRSATADTIDGFLATSVGGYAGDGEPTECSFVVRPPTAAWARRNLPSGKLVVEHRPDGGIVVRGRVRGVEALARFVVGLGAAASSDSPELAEAVRTLARGALEANVSS